MTDVAVAAIPAPSLRAARLRPVWLVAGIAAVAVAAGAGLVMGPVALSPVEVLRELVGLHSALDGQQIAIVEQIRLPRVVLGLLVGSTLSLCGASYQGVFRNPLADPYLLGAAAGAGLGVTIVIVGAADGSATPALAPLAAFVGALAAVALTYALGTSGGGRASTASLILAGVAVASFLTAMQTYVQQRNQDTIRQVYSWILGPPLDGRVARGVAAAALRRRHVGRAAGPSSRARRAGRRRRRGGHARRGRPAQPR